MNDEEPPSAPPRGTGLALVKHWDWVAERGLMPRNTALAIRAAISQILKIEPGWEVLEVQSLDVDGLVSRFQNLSKLSPGSLRTYESRFRTGVDSYLAYLDNPAGYQPRGRRGGRSADQTRTRRSVSRSASEQRHEQTASSGDTTAPLSLGEKLVVYPFPIRPALFAELRLPADLSLAEAQRLGKFLETLAISTDPGRGD